MKKKIFAMIAALSMGISLLTMDVSAAELTQPAELTATDSGAEVSASDTEAEETESSVSDTGPEEQIASETDTGSGEEQSASETDTGSSEKQSAESADYEEDEKSSEQDADSESDAEEAEPEATESESAETEDSAMDTSSATALSANSVTIVRSILTNNPCYTEESTIKVKGLMLHSVGCSQPNASVFIKNWNVSTHDNTCVHAFIDGNTGVVYQTLPWNHRGWHCGHGTNGSGNDTHIGVEMCEPACITYTGSNTFTMTDVAAAQASVKRTYESAVELFAMLCVKYDLDPMEEGVIISHREGHTLGIASNHGDPEHLWRGVGLPYTMDTFRAAVKARIEEGVTEDDSWFYEEETDEEDTNGDNTLGENNTEETSDVTKIFTDVPSGSWYQEAVQYVYDKGLMTGMNKTTFGPAVILSRAQFAVILWRMNGSPAEEYTSKFPDISEGTWYTDAVLWANSAGVVTGYENGMFGPADMITREQMAVMMYRYANFCGYDCSEADVLDDFTDADMVSGFAEEAMEWAVGMKIITGKQNGTALEPQSEASRAECATIIMRFMKAYT